MSAPGSDAALVLFSGGQDSAVCLAWALERFARVETIGFRYGQRHMIEMDVRPRVLAAVRTIRADWDLRLDADHVVPVDVIGAIAETALTRDMEIEASTGGLPNTFVPGRNLMFLSVAGALAYRRGIGHLVGGMCETDYSGYPDCRRDTIDAMERALSLGMDRGITIHTPLMRLSKSDTFNLAVELGGQALLDAVVEETHTCYLGDREHRHPWGYGCGQCPACALRARGFEEFRTRHEH